MSKVTVNNLEKSFGGRDLFKGLGFELSEGMRLAVAGPNGCGKSTLLRILAGRERADCGEVHMGRQTRLGYVAQELSEDDLSRPLLAWVLDAIPSWSDFWSEWEDTAAKGDERRIQQLSSRQAELEQAYGYNPDVRARSVLTGLGFDPNALDHPIAELSGGWRERAKLGRVLLQGADVLLLDEPTNHLDMEAVEWLEEYLLEFQGALAFVAHDRWFLDRLSSHVLFVSGGRHVLRPGNFTSFLEWEAESSRLRKKEATKLEASIKHEYDYIRRFRVKARKAAQAQSKLKRVERMEEELDRIKGESAAARSGRTLSFSLPDPARSGRSVLHAVDLEFAYPGGEKLWPTLNFQLFRGTKAALCGPNGAGKSTLLKLAAGQFEPSGGAITLGANVKLGYFSQHRTEQLRRNNSVIAEIRRMAGTSPGEQELRDVLGLFLLGEDFFDRKVDELSGGEKGRLLLASLFLSRCNFLILDEPTNHLDLESRQALVDALREYDGTVFLVAHDRHLIDQTSREVWVLSEEGLDVRPGGFREYEAARREAARREMHREGNGKSLAEEGQPDRQNSFRTDKEERRRQAEIRNRSYKKIKPKRDEYEALEKDLDQVAERHQEVEELLADHATYADKDKFASLHQEYESLNGRFEDLSERMHQLETEITALEGERDRLMAG